MTIKTNIMTSVSFAVSLAFALSTTLAHAAPPVTQFEYDANGNLTKAKDALNHATTQQYDAINRLIQQNQPHPTTANTQQGVIGTQYNAIDEVTGVTDPRSLSTTYTKNAYGEVLTLVSPDTGTTTNTYDAAGNLITKLDAKGQTTTYSYDVLNRLTQAQFADSQVITYSYDQGTHGLGHLTGITDSTGTTAYSYDSRGRVTSEVRTINSIAYTTTYAYNADGQLTGVAYPTGLVLTYTHDSLGRIDQISATKNSQTQVIASSITYQPFGGLKSLTFGNSATYSRGYDTTGRLNAYTLGPQTINLDYDLASRITAATDSVNNADTKTYAYDNLDRLTTFTAPTTNQGYGYDLTGNRTSLTVGANTYSNTIASNSNRLTATTGPTAKTYTFDNNGSITADTVNQFTYNARGRLVQTITPAGTVTYGVNALGQRVLKTFGSNSTIYHYDLNGQLIAETDASGTVKQEVIYLGNMPLAVMSAAGQSYYIYTDQLNTPRLITDSVNSAVWRWDNTDPFANNPANDDPNNTNTHFTFNQRFPGQYYDMETNTNYNYHRDYDPQTGRYIESDPIGLAGGINTYAYVESDPLSYTDPLGLASKGVSSGKKGSDIDNFNQRGKDNQSAGDAAELGNKPAACAFAFLSSSAREACMPTVCVEWRCTPYCGEPYPVYKGQQSITDPETKCKCVRRDIDTTKPWENGL